VEQKSTYQSPDRSLGRSAMPHNRSIITTGGAFAALMTTSPVPDTPQTISRPFTDAPVSVDKHSIPDPAFRAGFAGGNVQVRNGLVAVTDPFRLRWSCTTLGTSPAVVEPLTDEQVWHG